MVELNHLDKLLKTLEKLSKVVLEVEEMKNDKTIWLENKSSQYKNSQQGKEWSDHLEQVDIF